MNLKRKSSIIALVSVFYSLLFTCRTFAQDATKPATGDSGFGVYIILAILSGLIAIGSCAFLLLRRKSENR